MNTRGQVYLLAALLLGVVIFGLMYKLNVAHTQVIDDDFIEISTNYDRESSRFVNYLAQGKLHNDFNLTTLINNFSEFTVDFSSYAKTQNSHFGFVYLFDVSEQTNAFFVGNYLDQDLVVYVNNDIANSILLYGCYSSIQAGAQFDSFGIGAGISLSQISDCSSLQNITSGGMYNVTFVIGDVSYSVPIVLGVPEIVIVSNAFNDRQREVFVNDYLVEGKRIIIRSFCQDQLPLSVSSLTELCNCDKRNNEERCEELNSLGCLWSNNDCVMPS